MLMWMLMFFSLAVFNVGHALIFAIDITHIRNVSQQALRQWDSACQFVTVDTPEHNQQHELVIQFLRQNRHDY